MMRGSGIWRIALKAALIALALLTSPGATILQASIFGWTWRLLPFALTYALAVALILAAAFAGPRAVRFAFAALFALATAVTVAFQEASGARLTYFDFVTMIEARSAIGDSLRMFPGPVSRAVLSAALLFAGIFLAPPPRLRRWPLAIAPLIGFAALCATVQARAGEGSAGLPPAWVGLGHAYYYAQQRAGGLVGPREPVAIARAAAAAPPRDIVLIVDESVAGNYLDINGPGGVRSGLAQPRAGWRIANFGLAAAISNCSVASNYMLRYGGTRENRRAIIARKPSIWRYAHAAGLRTVYLYGQTGIGDENRMTDVERRDIDAAVYVKGDPLTRDQRIAALLAARLRNGVAEFVLVNKYGAHFPVDAGYPASHMRYRPALPRAFGLATLAARPGGWGGAAGWLPYRNSYRNTLTWTVGAFMDRLFDGRDGDAATIIYTSDHGQDLHERGTPGKMTHCHASPEMEEGVVPIVAIERGPSAIDWTAAAARGRDASSHYRIFPTLLALMGYDPAEVERVYGPSFASPRRDPMTFAAKLLLDTDAPPDWHMVTPAQVVRPPASDLAPSAVPPQPLRRAR